MRKRAVAVIIRKKKILLLRRFKKGVEYFTLPGGGKRKSETPSQAAAREAKEEVCLIVRPKKFIGQIRNLGHDEYYIVMESLSGKPKLGRDLLRQTNKNNKYIIVWLRLSDFYQLTNFYPKKIQNVLAKELRN
ncbi:MAG: NUDIX domain-containing protein [Patescibacteria group bacterium]